MNSISIKSFKRFVIFSFFLACLSFFIGIGWNHKEMKRLKWAGQVAFWSFQNGAKNKVAEQSKDTTLIMWSIESALLLKDYSHASDHVIDQLEHWKDSLSAKTK